MRLLNSTITNLTCKFAGSIFLLTLLFFLLIAFPSCDKTETLSFKLSSQTDSLLKDTIKTNPFIDSLRTAIINCETDSVCIDLMNELSENLKLAGAKLLTEEALNLSKKTNYEKGQAAALCNKAILYYKTDLPQKGDSILMSLVNTSSDLHIKAEAMSYVGEACAQGGNFKDAETWLLKSLKLADELKDEKRQSYCNYKLAEVSRMMDNHSQSLQHSKAALKYYKKTNNTFNTALCYQSLGSVYLVQADYSKSLESYNRALSLFRLCNDERKEASLLVLVGEVLRLQHENIKALEYFNRATVKLEKLKNKNYLAYCYALMAETFHEIDKENDAIIHAEKAIKMAEEIGDKDRIIFCFSTLGHVYRYLGDFKKAENYFNEALQLAEELKDQSAMAIALFNKADMFFKTSKIQEAINIGEKTLELAIKYDFTEFKQKTAELLFKAYKVKGNYKKSLSMLELSSATKDSIQNTDEVRKIANMEYKIKEDELTFTQQAKEKVLVLENQKKEEEIKNQKLVRNSITGGAIALLLLAFFIYRNLKQSHLANKIITKQKREVEEQKRVIEEQKELVEEHQKEIIDSIRYAKRIQQALLPTQKYIGKSFDRLRNK